jgi:hypothetical protein
MSCLQRKIWMKVLQEERVMGRDQEQHTRYAGGF